MNIREFSSKVDEMFDKIHKEHPNWFWIPKEEREQIYKEYSKKEWFKKIFKNI